MYRFILLSANKKGESRFVTSIVIVLRICVYVAYYNKVQLKTKKKVNHLKYKRATVYG